VNVQINTRLLSARETMTLAMMRDFPQFENRRRSAAIPEWIMSLKVASACEMKLLAYTYADLEGTWLDIR